MNRPVIVIGGTGLVGPHLVSSLESMGIESICLNRSGHHPSGGQAIACNRDSPRELSEVLRDSMISV